MAARLIRLSEVVLVRYVLASALALGFDLACFLALLAAGTPAIAAAALGYSLGILVHWLLSSRAVFTLGVAQQGPQRTRQKAMFVGSAFFGLTLTSAVVASGTSAGLDPRLAKLAAVAISFTATWLLRERLIFRPGRAS